MHLEKSIACVLPLTMLSFIEDETKIICSELCIQAQALSVLWLNCKMIGRKKTMLNEPMLNTTFPLETSSRNLFLQLGHEG